MVYLLLLILQIPPLFLILVILVGAVQLVLTAVTHNTGRGQEHEKSALLLLQGNAGLHVRLVGWLEDRPQP